MSGAMPGEIAGAAGGAGGAGKGGGKGGGAGGGSPMDFSNTGTGMLNNLDPATMGAGTTAGLTGDPTGSLGATAAAVAGGPPTGDMAFQGPPQGTTPTPPPTPAPNAQPSLPPIGAPIPDAAFGGPPAAFTPGGTPRTQGPTATPGGGPPAGQGFGGGNVTQATPEPTPVSIGSTGLSPSLADLVQGYGGGSPTQEATNVVPFPRAQPVPELGWDVPQPFAAPTAGAVPTGDVGGGIRGVPPVDQEAITPPTAGAVPTGDVGGGIRGTPPDETTVPPTAGAVPTGDVGGGIRGVPPVEPPAGQGFGGGSPTQTAEGPPTPPRGEGFGGGRTEPPAPPRIDPSTGQPVPPPSPPRLAPTGPARAAPGTRAAAPAPQGQPSPFETGVNPLKLFGDFLTMALTGNPYPLMSDLGGLAGQAAGQPPGGTPGAFAPTPQQAAANPASQQPNLAATGDVPGGTPMPGGYPNDNASPAAEGFGETKGQENQTRPDRYGGILTLPDGTQVHYATGGGRFPSSPYGQYYIHPGAIGNTGRKIGAIAGVSDSTDPGDNTIHDSKWGRPRRGIEIHPANGYTNGCFGVNRSEWGAFQRAFRQAAAQGPLMLTVKPDGSATISAVTQPGVMTGPQQQTTNQQSQATQASNQTGGTRGDRNNNPGNIKKGPWTTRAVSYDAQGHAIYNSAEDGIADHADLLRGKYNNMTVQEMSRVYTTTNQASWARTVMQVGGFSPNERLDLSDPGTLDRLQRAIWRAEGTSPRRMLGRQSSAADFLSDQGFQMVG